MNVKNVLFSIRWQGLILLSLIFLLTNMYNACSEVEFDTTVGLKKTKLNESTLRINNGDSYTQYTNVNLSISSSTAENMYLTNDPTCSSGGVWENYGKFKSWVLSSPNQLSKVFVKFKDGDGFESNCINDDILHDDLPPEINFINVVTGFSNQSNVNTKFEVVDNLTGMGEVHCQMQGADIGCEALVISGILSVEGAVGISVVATDKAGNMSSPKIAQWIYDKTPPSIQFTTQPSNPTGPESKFKFIAMDLLSPIASYECQIDGSTITPCQTSQLFSSLSNGAHDFEVRATDAAGNEGEFISYNWSVDLLAPVISIDLGPENPTNNATALFEFSGSDNGQAIQDFLCKLDGSAFSDCTSGKTYSNLSEGVHVFQIKAKDSMGNESAPILYTWLVDLTPPVVEITESPSSYSNQTASSISWSFSDNLTSIKGHKCELDGADISCDGGVIVLTDLAEGDHEFVVRIEDQAGNISSPATVQWIVDLTSPSIEIVSAPAILGNSLDAELVMTATDDRGVVVIKCQIDGLSFLDCSSPKNYSQLTEGAHVFSVYAEDAAKNTSNILTHEWTIDTSGPLINFMRAPSDHKETESSTLEFEVTDSPAGVQSVNCEFNGLAVECAPPHIHNFADLTVGAQSFIVTATDTLGNSSSMSHAWEVWDKFEHFNQDISMNSSNKVDILFVIDNSGSMASEHRNMAEKINTFLEKLDGLDWQIGITTTDPNDNGQLLKRLSGEYLLTSEMNYSLADSQVILGNAIQMPTNGSGSEQGVAATYYSIDRYQASIDLSAELLDEPSTAITKFFRSDSHFATVLISDENESASSVANIPDNLIQLVEDTWSGEKSFVFHSIIVKPGDTYCKSRSYHTYGYRYSELSEKTGGIIGSVCETDYSSQLTSIGQGVKDALKTVELSCLPQDIDDDGLLDIIVTLADGSQVTNFTVNGNKIVFDAILPQGIHNFDFYCFR